MKFGKKIATIAGRCLKNKPQSQSKKTQYFFYFRIILRAQYFLGRYDTLAHTNTSKTRLLFRRFVIKMSYEHRDYERIILFFRLVDSVSASVDEMTIISLDKCFISIIFIGCHFKTSNLHFVFILNGDIQGLP